MKHKKMFEIKSNRNDIWQKWIMFFLFILTSTVYSQSLEEYGFQFPKVRVKANEISLRKLDRGNYQSKKDNGRLMIIHFWATWCKPCMKELPALNKLYQRIDKNHIVILTINVNRSNVSRVETIVKKLKLELPVLLDPRGIVRNAYEVEAFPTTFIIGTDQKFIARLVGAFDWNHFNLKVLDKYS